MRGIAEYFWAVIRVFGIVAVTTLIVGVGALLIAFFIIDADKVGEVARYGNEINDDVAFARSGVMHNFSYLGGMIGIITGALAIYALRLRQLNAESHSNGKHNK